MAKANLTGEQKEIKDSPLLEHEGRYVMEFLDASVREVKKIDWTGGVPKDTGEKENKILVNWIRGGDPYPMFLNPNVTKGGTVKQGDKTKEFDNSKMYDLMNRMGVLEDFSLLLGDADEINDEELASFLNESLSGKSAEVEIKNTKGDEPKSNVSKVIKKAGE